MTQNAEVRSTTASGVGPGQGSLVYESARAVDEYVQFHFADPKDLLPFACGPHDALQFPARLAKLCDDYAPKTSSPRSALDMGCAVGGATFELTRTFDEVQGIDFSHAFIAAANDIKTAGQRQFRMLIEGAVTELKVAKLPEGVHPDRAMFAQGDACALADTLGPFDAILAANLLCRLPSPLAFLNRASSLLKQDGVLVLVSPYSWLEEYTDKTKWLGGYTDADGKSVFSAEAVKKVLEGNFQLVFESDMPFLIREHRRKYQWGCSHVTVWKKL